MHKYSVPDLPSSPIPGTATDFFKYNPWNLLSEPSSKSIGFKNELPHFVQPSTSLLPISHDLFKSIGIPIGIVFSPGDALQVNKINYSQHKNILRCSFCNSIFCPWSQISPDNHHWKCPFCGRSAIYLDETISLNQREEHNYGVNDIYVPRSFIHHQYVGPAFHFIIDISHHSISSGFAQNAANYLLNSLDTIDPLTGISLMTIDKNVTIFNLKKLTRTSIIDFETYPHILPLYPLKDIKNNFQKILQLIIKESQEKITQDQKVDRGHCFGEALKISSSLLIKFGGIVAAFIYNKPVFGRGCFIPRSSSDIATEPSLLKPPKDTAAQFYHQIASEFQRSVISLHLFFASDTFSELSTLGMISGVTGGHVHYYPNFSIKDGPFLNADIHEMMTTKFYYDASISLQMSGDVSVKQISGNGYLSKRDTIFIPIYDPHDSIVFDLLIPPHITSPSIMFQFTMLFTDSQCRRIMRVVTFALSVSQSSSEILAHMNESAIFTLFVHRSIIPLLTESPAIAAASFTKEIKRMQILNQPKSQSGLNNHNIPSTNYSPIFKVLDQLSYGFLSSPLLADKCVLPGDGRMSIVLQIRSFNVVDSILFSCPRLLNLENHILPPKEEILLDNEIIFIHCQNIILVWGKKISTIEENVGKIEDGFILSENITQKANQVITQCWEISRRYLLIRAITGPLIQDFLIEPEKKKERKFLL